LNIFFPAWRDGDPTRPGTASRIEGIGRPRVEPSFVGPIVDRMQRVPDAASVAMMRELEGILGRRVGPSTGTSVWACFELIGQMRDDGVAGSIVTLLCDSGDRYAETYFDDEWVARQGWDLTPFRGAVRDFMAAP
jgi:cysteine synthase A